LEVFNQAEIEMKTPLPSQNVLCYTVSKGVIIPQILVTNLAKD